MADILASSLAQASDVAHSLQSYLRRTEIDPTRLAELDARISQWLQLARRHKRPPRNLPALLKDWKTSLAQLDASSDLAALVTKADASGKAFHAAARALSVQRTKAAPRLSLAISTASSSLPK